MKMIAVFFIALCAAPSFADETPACEWSVVAPSIEDSPQESVSSEEDSANFCEAYGYYDKSRCIEYPGCTIRCDGLTAVCVSASATNRATCSCRR